MSNDNISNDNISNDNISNDDISKKEKLYTAHISDKDIKKDIKREKKKRRKFAEKFDDLSKLREETIAAGIDVEAIEAEARKASLAAMSPRNVEVKELTPEERKEREEHNEKATKFIKEYEARYRELENSADREAELGISGVTFSRTKSDFSLDFYEWSKTAKRFLPVTKSIVGKNGKKQRIPANPLNGKYGGSFSQKNTNNWVDFLDAVDAVLKFDNLEGVRFYTGPLDINKPDGLWLLAIDLDHDNERINQSIAMLLDSYTESSRTEGRLHVVVAVTSDTIQWLRDQGMKASKETKKEDSEFLAVGLKIGCSLVTGDDGKLTDDQKIASIDITNRIDLERKHVHQRDNEIRFIYDWLLGEKFQALNDILKRAQEIGWKKDGSSRGISIAGKCVSKYGFSLEAYQQVVFWVDRLLGSPDEWVEQSDRWYGEALVNSNGRVSCMRNDFHQEAEDKGIITASADFYLRNNKILLHPGNIDRPYLYRNGNYIDDEGKKELGRAVQKLLYDNEAEDFWTTRREKEITELILRKLHNQHGSPRVELEPPSNMCKVLNGVVDLDTGKRYPHSPDFKWSAMLNFRYEQLPPGKWRDSYFYKNWVKVMMQPDSYLLPYLMLGTTIAPSVHWFIQSFFLYGPGGTGKSTLMRLIERFFPDYLRCHISLQDLSDESFKAGLLAGKLINSHYDGSSNVIKSVNQFKSSRSGEYMTADLKFVQPFEFMPMAQHFFGSNTVAICEEAQGAYYDRIFVVMLLNRLRNTKGEIKKEELEKILYSPSELNAFFNGAMEVRKLAREGKFIEPASSLEGLELFKSASNPILDWVKENLIKTDNQEDFIYKGALWEMYLNSAITNKYKRVTEKQFKDYMTEEEGIELTTRMVKGERSLRYLRVKKKPAIEQDAANVSYLASETSEGLEEVRKQLDPNEQYRRKTEGEF